MLKLPANTDLQMTWYNTSHALWMAGFSIQQLLATWILVGILDQSPETVGLAQLLIGVPALIFMLWGGVIGDRVDGRGLLIQSHLLSIIPPLVLALAVYLDQLGVWILILTALVANLLNSASNPARNTILNLVAGGRLQWAISLSTGIGAIATMIGTRVAGSIDQIGLVQVLLLQSACFGVGAIFLIGLRASGPSTDAPSPNPNASSTALPQPSTYSIIRAGLVYTWRFKLARDLVGLNFFSSFFNAGAWMVAIPFIISRIYAGDALLLANITVVFYFGSLIANFGLLKFMPLSRPGQVYLILQLSRVLVLYLIWYEPSMTWLWIAAAFWGFNMGVTNTMSRVMIQEIAEPAFRARLMSVFTLGLMSATPMGSLVLGIVIGQFGELNALIPGMLASIMIFYYGYKRSDIWQYRSPVLAAPDPA